MWYVIQTCGGEEEKTAALIRKRVPSYYMEDCFIPKRERMKKFHGCWNKVEEILFHGYVFVVSRQPEGLYRELQRIPKLTKILGREKDYFIPLNKEEELFVQKIGNKEHKTEISKVQIQEGKQIRVVEGPLKNYVGNIVKADLHKREVLIQINFMDREMQLRLGIEMVEMKYVCGIINDFTG